MPLTSIDYEKADSAIGSDRVGQERSRNGSRNTFVFDVLFVVDDAGDRDNRSGRPGKPCGESWIRAEFTCHEEEVERTKATGILYTIQKASRLKSQSARVRKLKEVKDRIKDEKFLRRLIRELGLGHKNADPKEVADRIAQLHSLLNDTDDDIDTTIQKIKKLPYLKQLVQDIPDIDDKIDLSIASEIDPQNITGKVEKALNALQDYKNLSKNIAELSDRIKNSKVNTQEEYDELFDEMESLFSQLKDNVTTIKNIGEVKTGSAQADLELNEYLAFAGSVSREALPGYKVSLPKDLNKIKDKAATDPC